MGVSASPIAGLFMMENLMNMDDLGVIVSMSGKLYMVFEPINIRISCDLDG